MSFIFGGGGGGGGGGATTGTQTTIAREAPEVEARKLSLYDEALRLAQDPVQLPGYQVAPPSALEKTGFGLAGTTGVGAGGVTTGIGTLGTGVSQVGTALGQAGTAMTAPTTAGLSPYFNPYESYVTDEINRQSSMRQNELGAQAVASGAFGGARQGVASAELDRARLNQIGQLRAQGFQTALGGFQRQQQMGMAGAQMYGQLGQQQQAMGQADISSVMQAGGIQRQLGQQALEAQRMTGLQRQYEPYQRLEFMKGLMTNLPTGQSAMTATTAPGTNPLAQAAGAGIGAYAAYQMANRPQQIKMV